jgi:hypothetical protein
MTPKRTFTTGRQLGSVRCMARRILTVEDTFEIKGRGLIVVPGPLVEAYDGPTELPVEVKRPDGSVLNATLHFTQPFIHSTPKVFRWALIFRGLMESDVPIGSEVWG